MRRATFRRWRWIAALTAVALCSSLAFHLADTLAPWVELDGLALTAIFYEMLSGQIAFNGNQVAEILMKIVNAMPAPLSQVKPGLPHALDDVIEKGLAKDKKRRYGSTLELAAASFSAFGLTTTADRAAIEAWGKKPVSEIASALVNATPQQAAG